MNLREQIVDWYLTRTTGRTRAQREWDQWREKNINSRARTVNSMFANFKHLLVLDPNKFLSEEDPFCWCPVPDAKKYFWPDCPLGSNAVWCIQRVTWNHWQQEWDFCDISGEDLVFVATNNDADATLLTLQFS